jgi:hypothetical protein
MERLLNMYLIRNKRILSAIKFNKNILFYKKMIFYFHYLQTLSDMRHIICA